MKKTLEATTCRFWMVGLVGFITGWLAGILGIGGGLFRMAELNAKNSNDEEGR